MGFILIMQGITDIEEVATDLDNAMKRDMLLVQSLASLVCLVIFALWYYKKLADKNRPTMKKVFEGETILWIISLGLGMQLGISLFMNLLVPLLPETFDQYANHMEMLGMGSAVVSFIYLGIIAPFS